MSSAHSPSASLDTLKQAAHLRAVIHQWMREHDILEVITPPLSCAANTDPQVQSMEVLAGGSGNDAHRYLHTSPEFAMKRILCAYPDTDLYQIATVFRAEEQGRFHSSQFNMLEWYRTSMDHLDLMRDVQEFLSCLWHSFDLEFPGVDRRSYCQEVCNRLGQRPDDLQGGIVRDYFQQHDRSFPVGLEDDVNACLDLFMDEFVLPDFDPLRVTFLFEYPASQAALARIGCDANGYPVAQRFEVFVGALELANGFHELQDAALQRQRFEADQHSRKARQLQAVPMDEHLLDALADGLPDCAGIAMGLERLQMVLGKHSHINQVKAFCDDKA